MGWKFWIDRGGTFTDIVARDPSGVLIVRKLLSDDPRHAQDAVLVGMRAILGLAADAPIPDGVVDSIRMGTTVATNALLERKGERLLLLVNRGFRDVLVIGNQARPALFDLAITRAAPLYEAVVELAGRLSASGAELEALDEAAVLVALEEAYAAGLRACAIALVHSWKNSGHELQVAGLAARAGFEQISMSHDASPFIRLVPRAETAVVDAYLSPVLSRYTRRLAEGIGGTRLFFMQSYGGLTRAENFRGKDAILSGPAGGIVGAARTAGIAGLNAVICFDMGGTSTDVSLYDDAFELASEACIAGVHIRAPMMAIHTVAAGGGSVLRFDGARLRAGPESAGAAPGPACYRRGGPLTVTDANLCLGKIQPAYFPAIFGPDGDLPLDAETPVALFARMALDIEAATGIVYGVPELAEGFLKVAVANIAHAIKRISVDKGRNPADFTLNCFGGAGGQHACRVAEELGIASVFIHPLAGVLSAYGMGLADQMLIREQAIEKRLDAALFATLADIAAQLAADARAALASQGVADGAVSVRNRIHLCYEGTEATLVVPLCGMAETLAEFEIRHIARFGFSSPERHLFVGAVSVEVTAAGEPVSEHAAPGAMDMPASIGTARLWTGGQYHDARVLDRLHLAPGHRIAGPAIIIEATGTIVVEPAWSARVNAYGHVLLERGAASVSATIDISQPDPVMLELFNKRFMNIAEQSGVVLQNTAQSVNIRERLDFSCAIFDAGGNLVANAPHVPVHLGAMGESVKAVLKARGNTLRPGQVIALNDPSKGGTHLPDITVITPVFDDAGTELHFFAASRGHHADIGGITPGSTPPGSRTLEEEGVVIDNFLLVEGGQLREAAFRTLLAAARYPARSPGTNVADIKAQIAANEKSRQELQSLVRRHGWRVVSAYMDFVMRNAEEEIRRAISTLHDGQFHYTMDDGSPLVVAVRVDHATRSLVIDFAGTGLQRDDNFNAPPAVTRAVILYVLRCMVADDIPLNDGCLRPVEIRIPPGTFLSPAPGAAVVAGNTEVSQAVCNALLGALGKAASSQATMNNFLFGDGTRQYYETICGGIGAGPGFHGADAFQAHMTNTRMTDPEILELRYPVRVEEFAVRPNSGGAGLFHGGNGATRTLRFLEPMQAMIVASQREVDPFGLNGGKPGARGRQWIQRANGATEPLSGRAAANMHSDDTITIETPGGGGYGMID